jgi:hypothetical protein
MATHARAADDDLVEFRGEADRLARVHEEMLASVAALGPAMHAVARGASPQLARATQAQENLYDRIDAQFGLLDSAAAGRRLGSSAGRPGNAALQARAEGRLVALKRGARLYFPGFQFDADGRPLAVIGDLVQTAAAAGRSERGLVEWLGSPSSFFDGVPPAAYLADDPTAVAEAASSAFGTAW